MNTSSSKKIYMSSHYSAQKGAASFFENPDFFKTLLDYSGDQIVIFDEKGQFLYLNYSALAAFGYSRSYMLKKKVVDFLKGKISLAKWKREYFDRAKKRQKPIVHRIERVVKGGAVQVLDVTSVYVPYGNSGVLLSVGRDATRATQLKRAVKETRDLYRVLMDRAGDGILVIDLKGRISYANKTMQELTGYSPKAFHGKHFKYFIHKISLAKAQKFFNAVKKGEKVGHLAIDILTASGESIPIETNASPVIENNKISAVQVIARDSRPRLAMEAGHREEEKMNALRFFVSGTAQEVKNPLLAICKQTNMVLQKYADRDFEYVSYKEFQDILKNFKKVHDRVSYCYETIDRLLRVSESKIGIHHDICSVQDVLKKAIRLKEEDLHFHGIHYRLKKFRGDVKVGIGEIDLIQVFVNVINNAIQAMPSGGGLLIKVSLVRQTDSAIVEFKDQGVGIAEEVLEHIFEPFFTTKVRGIRKNSGLGLPIAYSLVKRIQGDMTVESSLGRGTTIRIIFPIHHSKRKTS